MDTTISIRANSTIKNKAIKVLNSHGLSLSAALNMYLADIANKKTAPSSDIRYVKDEVITRLEREYEYEKKHGDGFSSIEDLMADLVK